MEEIATKKRKPQNYFPIQQIHSFDEIPPRLPSRNRKIKSPVRSMKGKINQLMINVTLSKNFDKKQFKIISSIPPDQWIISQKQLMRKICCDKTLYEQSFAIFYKNHHTIANWSQLSTEQNSQIQPYVFRQLLRHRKSQYAIYQSFNNERVKDSINIIKKKTMANINNRKNSYLADGQLVQNNDSNFNVQSQNASFIKPSLQPKFSRQKHSSKKQKSLQKQPATTMSQKKQQVMSVFFSNSLSTVTKQKRRRKPLNLQRFKQHTKKQPHDAHQFYMKTFDACNGWNYIFYDYERHMKGFGQKVKYNKFVRCGGGDGGGEESGRYRSMMMGGENQQSSSRQMKRFVEFDQFRAEQQSKSTAKCSLLPINLVLNQRQLNNYKGLKRIVNQNNSSKVVFVNHQGKPITYYIKKDEQQKGYNLGEMGKKAILRKSVCVTEENKAVASCAEGNSATIR